MSSTTSGRVAVVGAGESPYTRHPAAGTTTAGVLGDAVRRALADAGLTTADVDGFGVSSFTLQPDHAVDLAWRLGLRVDWLMQDTNGGASAGGMLQHAVRAVEAGDASVVVLVAGDLMDREVHVEMVRRYNRATAEHLAPLPMTGPNALFAMLTRRQMDRFGLAREDYGRLVVAQRAWAAANPGAVYRTPLDLEEYLAAPTVAEPLGRYDCVPPVTGADAVVVAAETRASGRCARVLAVATTYNTDDQAGDGLTTGVASCAPRAFEHAGVEPADVDVVSVYDDYPAMVVAQLADLGLPGADDLPRLLALVGERNLPVNTSGGQLSAGQPGAGGGMHGLVEVVRQLRGQADGRQVGGRIGVVTGYGMVLYRHGACGNVAVLEAA
ncbi:acetyl-CoA acetyltransferase [Nocardioides zeae]|uniref:Acetyl-CoA acetyltransferase n=1 Tax=Nocardioides zeae TaxID=1457234 RepID=A0ACC6IFM2_9ACTN|nr:thiolase family protein [Nocardioides zeae]MDR6176519.1 acetyl-CoA acetyltransferase [Nocardioides zeae]MDR6209531.1 acetyl-CoA acetyltransferase [Nocardioides zeae]